MSFQRIFQAKPDPAKPLQTKSLFAPRPAPFQESAQEESAFPPIHLGRDFSAIPFKPVHPAPALGPSSISCPFTPERCPFGGACHACPPKMQMQAKLKIGQPGDRYEQEADRVAEQVMRMPEPQAQRKAACASCADKDEDDKLMQTKPLAEQITPLVQRKPGPEAEKKDEDDDELVQAKSASGIGNAQEVHHPLIQSVLASPGQPLDAATRSFMEPRFGQDFSGVRVHVGGQAAESARAVNARAYTVGRDVVFGEGQYAPGSDEGKRLVAHELAHVGQQKGISAVNSITAPILNRKLDPDITFTLPELYDPAHIVFGFDGIFVTPDRRDRFAIGAKVVQAIAIVIHAWALSSYTRDLVLKVYSALAKAFPSANPLPAFMGDAKGSETIPTPFYLEREFASWLLGFLDASGMQTNVTAAQRELLELGNAIDDLFNLYRVGKLSVKFPKWYPIETIGRNDLANFGNLLRDYSKKRSIWLKDKTPENETTMLGAADKLLQAVAGPVMALEEIRKDADLAGHPSYKLIWPSGKPTEFKVGEAMPTSPASGSSTAGTPVPEDRQPNPKFGSGFINFARTQPLLLSQVFDPKEGAKARRVLLDNFIQWAPGAFAVVPTDTKILDAPAMANLRPHPARLFALPPIGPPLFDAAIQADYHFTMQLNFPDVFDAMAAYNYQWERTKVSDDKIKAATKLSKNKGNEPSLGEVASLRYKRIGQYAYEDISRTIGTYIDLVGGPGTSVELVALNSAFRFIGTSFSLGIEKLSTPKSEKAIAFPDGEGLYLVTCRANQIHKGQGFIRAQSVAWLPVFVRDAGQMSEIRLAAAVTNREDAKKRLKEIKKLLSDPKTPDRDALVAEGEALAKSLESHVEALEQRVNSLNDRKEALEKQIAELGTDPNNVGKVFTLREELRQIEKQLEPIEDIRKTRQGRAKNLAKAQDLTAVFVSDEGKTLYLALEAALISQDKKQVSETWYVSDTTTAKGGEETATASGRSAKRDAILQAVRSILEGDKGYGRGQLSIEIGKEQISLRIAASEGKMLLEAVENLATALSVAAVVAAPFTGGASLAILLPVGIIGAAPSTYRIIRNAADSTFRLDLEFAMDVVNIVGSLVGLGEAAVPLKFIRVGKALLIIGAGTNGLGVLLMGAQVMEQLLSLSDLPPGMRTARILQIIGQAMLQAGIMVGTVLAEKAKVGKMEAAVVASEGKALPEHIQKAYEEWRSRLEEPTRNLLDADPDLAKLYREMDPRVRRALTLCASDCIPTKPRPTADDIKRIFAIMDRLGFPPDHQGLREYLHRNRNDLTAAVDVLQNAKTLAGAQKVFDRSIASHAESGIATKKSGGRWAYKRDTDGIVINEWTIKPHGDNTQAGSSGFFQSHHGIQDAWAINVGLEKFGYTRDNCPAILLRDSHVGSPHQRVTARQKAREGNRSKRTYEEERQNLRDDMRAADVPKRYEEALLNASDGYFKDIYENTEKVLRKKGVADVQGELKKIFGNWYPCKP